MQSHSSLFAYNGMNQADEINSTQNESEKVLNLIFLIQNLRKFDIIWLLV